MTKKLETVQLEGSPTTRWILYLFEEDAKGGVPADQPRIRECLADQDNGPQRIYIDDGAETWVYDLSGQTRVSYETAAEHFRLLVELHNLR